MEPSNKHKEISEEEISENPLYEKSFSVIVDTGSFSVTYRFYYRKTCKKVEIEGKVIGSESKSCLDDEAADHYAAEQGKDALEAAVLYLKEKYPDIASMDIKPCSIGIYNAW